MSSIELSQNNNVATKLKFIYTKSSDTSTESSLEECIFESSKIYRQHQDVRKISQTNYGDLCTQYVPLSASSVFRHPYYNYPGVVDPGIKEALLHPEPQVIYPDDGQELYLALCKETGLSPIRSFYKELLKEKVNLKYYGVSQTGFRAIAISLKDNKYVKVIDLTDNWMNEDACFHLGEMLIENISLRELNLCGCRIGPEGAKRMFANLHINNTLQKVDLTKNYLGDAGVDYLTKAIFRGSNLRNITLCYNNLTAKALVILTEAFETHNKLTHLDLSWNTIVSPNAVFNLCTRLSENTVFEELNLSWTSLSGLRVGKAIKTLLTSQSLKYLNLSNNKLSDVAIKQIANGLENNRSLSTLDISYNPLTPKDALLLLLCLRNRKVKLQKLLLENIFVTAEFLELRREILSLKYRKYAVITWGGLIPKFTPVGADMRDIVLNRANAICSKSKKSVDIALIILELYKENKEPMDVKVFAKALRTNSVFLDEGLLEELSNSFAGPALGTGKTVNMVKLVDYLKRKWPDRQLPPTPPPVESEGKNKTKTDKKK
ncbi:unnamed protein product [Euphydryas editha]|uniref:Uncharacterized protein n=1 Tax=Euphydryas editha TaxID=104508 RepID=A0AAU9TN21_EUPED|nr:unnamed protein product [Euphydryas editha]